MPVLCLHGAERSSSDPPIPLRQTGRAPHWSAWTLVFGDSSSSLSIVDAAAAAAAAEKPRSPQWTARRLAQGVLRRQLHPAAVSLDQRTWTPGPLTGCRPQLIHSWRRLLRWLPPPAVAQLLQQLTRPVYMYILSETAAPARSRQFRLRVRREPVCLRRAALSGGWLAGNDEAVPAVPARRPAGRLAAAARACVAATSMQGTQAVGS